MDDQKMPEKLGISITWQHQTVFLHIFTVVADWQLSKLLVHHQNGVGG
jgi:hypothetical protein